jgi:hypothetical protein
MSIVGLPAQRFALAAVWKDWDHWKLGANRLFLLFQLSDASCSVLVVWI